jgi:anti-anti-sigma factor
MLVMDVSYAAVGEALVVAPVRRVDEASWEEFGRHLASGIEQAEQQSLPTLVIDLSSVDYMSSRGLRALTMAKQEGIGAGVSIRLAAPNDVMREILAISRYDRLFAVDPTAPGNGA